MMKTKENNTYLYNNKEYLIQPFLNVEDLEKGELIVVENKIDNEIKVEKIYEISYVQNWIAFEYDENLYYPEMILGKLIEVVGVK